MDRDDEVKMKGYPEVQKGFIKKPDIKDFDYNTQDMYRWERTKYEEHRQTSSCFGY
jgi:hypothetical protein